MALSKRWERVTQPLTLDGNTNGEVNVTDASDFFVKQKASIRSDTQQPIQVEVKKVFPTQILVGHIGAGLDDRIDISQFLIADNALIEAPTQPKPSLQPDEIFNAVLQHDPAGALRTLLVDAFGLEISHNNPLPTNSLSIADDTLLSYDPDTNNLIQVVFKKNSVTVLTLDLIYDPDTNNLIEVTET